MPAHVSLSTSSSLIARVKLRDDQAWDRFVELYLPVVYQWLRQLELQPADAADVAQTVFQNLANRIDTFDPARSTSGFRGWLWGVTRNAFVDHHRATSEEPQGRGGSSQLERIAALPAPPTEPPSSSSEFRNSVARRALELLRSDFESKTWQAFWRRVVDGQSVENVASDLGMTAGAVRQAKYRVLLRLREELGES